MGVTYLLDTHTLIWLTGAPERLPKPLLEDLQTDSTELMVSAATAMELATKVRIGKLPAARHLIEPRVWQAQLDLIRATHLELTVEHCLLAGSLPWNHRDPFDRFLAAQSIIEGVPLVTTDPAFASLPSVLTHW